METAYRGESDIGTIPKSSALINEEVYTVVNRSVSLSAGGCSSTKPSTSSTVAASLPPLSSITKNGSVCNTQKRSTAVVGHHRTGTGEQAAGASAGVASSIPHVLRTRSAEELEHYRLTSFIVSDKHREVTISYEIGEVLGEGSSGIIRSCVHKATGLKYAIKSIQKVKLTCAEAVEDVQNEVSIMKAIGRHPCVLGLKDVFEDYHSVHLILELCEGGDLYERIQEKKTYSEMEAARVCRRLLSALHHLHGMGYMHRDIKPENILLVSKKSNVDIRVADFGQAVAIRPDKMLTQTVGSVFYVAPEVLHRHYSSSADVWSVGIILFILLSGKPPFSGHNRRSTFEMIKYAPVDFDREPWDRVSADAKDLIQRMLDRNPDSRITAAEAKLHPWMMKYCPTIQTLPAGKPMAADEPSPVSTLARAINGLSLSSASSSSASSPATGKASVPAMDSARLFLRHRLPRSPSTILTPSSVLSMPLSRQSSSSDIPIVQPLVTYSSLPSPLSLPPSGVLPPPIQTRSLDPPNSLKSPRVRVTDRASRLSIP